MTITVLVTGGAGYIGSHACLELLNSGYRVVVTDNLANSKYESLNRVQQITGKTLTFYQGDIRDRNTLAEVFAKEPIDAVMHFAGLKAVGESCAQPLHYYHNNVYGTLVLAQAMAEAGVKNWYSVRRPQSMARTRKPNILRICQPAPSTHTAGPKR